MDPLKDIWGFFDDDGPPFNTDLYPMPALCLICKKNDQPKEEILCQLNRLDLRIMINLSVMHMLHYPIEHILLHD